MEEQGADTGEEQGSLDGKGQAIALHQDGDQHGGTKHGEHVLKAQDEHLGNAQLTRVADSFVVVHLLFTPFTFLHTKKAITASVIAPLY